MSLLTPLYLLGAASIIAPIIFHMIRREPKGSIPVSSLMFFPASQPRITKRSRLDNWPLLLLRALILTLIAITFARPFLNIESQMVSEATARRVILLIDTSASIRREGLWDQAKQFAQETIDGLTENDQFLVLSFDDEVDVLARSDSETNQSNNGTHTFLAEQAIEKLQPSWRATRLGQALSAATAIGTEETTSNNNSEPRQIITQSEIVLISDLQSGSDFESLQKFRWPDDFTLTIRRVIPTTTTNAAAFLMKSQGTETTNEDSVTAVRVVASRSSDSTSPMRLNVGWLLKDQTVDAESLQPLEIAPGENQIIRLQNPPKDAIGLKLDGDKHSFDNIRYFVSPSPQSLRVMVLDDASVEPSESLHYYLKQVPLGSSQNTIEIALVPRGESVPTLDPFECPLVITSRALESGWNDSLKRYVRAGGQILFVIDRDESASEIGNSIGALFDEPPLISRSDSVNDYAMMTRIDFTDPTFAPLAQPQFNDFSKIRFWRFTTIDNLPDPWHVIAAFEGRQPAIVKRSLGQGTVYLMTAGWQPRESQFALSTKFVPWISQMVRQGIQRPALQPSYLIGDPLPMKPVSEESIQQPGIHSFVDAGKTLELALNLSPTESQVDPLDDDQLVQFGVQLAAERSQANLAEEQMIQRELRNRELEQNQQHWRWWWLGAIALLGLEMLWGGRHGSATA